MSDLKRLEKEFELLTQGYIIRRSGKMNDLELFKQDFIKFWESQQDRNITSEQAVSTVVKTIIEIMSVWYMPKSATDVIRETIKAGESE